LKVGHSSHRAARLKPVDLRGQPTEARAPPSAVPGKLILLRTVRAREELRWRQVQPTGLLMAVTGPREVGLEPGAWAAPPPPWIAAKSAH